MIKPIPNFPGYQVTDDGRVWSEPKKGSSKQGKFLQGRKDKSGHLYINIRVCGKLKNIGVHQLILETFVGPCPDGMECRHLDGNPQNNHISNLCWGTRSENYEDRIIHGISNRGSRHGLAKLTEEQVRVIFHAYHDGYYTVAEIAGAFDICESAVRLIGKKKRWGHLWAA